MGFASPAFLAGLAVLAIPVLVHLVERESRDADAFPSLMFIRRITLRTRRHRRLRDRALLALRCLALALLALAFARPYLDSPAVAPPPESAGTPLIVLLDRSYSMGYSDRWPRALDAAGAVLDSATAGTTAALVVFDTRASMAGAWSSDHAGLRAALATQSPGPGGTDLAGAFAFVEAALDARGEREARVVLVSDLQRTGLDDGARASLPETVVLEVVPVTAEPAANAVLAAMSLVPSGRDALRGALVTTVRNDGELAVSGARLTLSVDGKALGEREVELAPGEAASFEFPLAIPATEPVVLALELSADALAADNRAWLVGSPPDPVRVAVLEPRRPRPGLGLFLREALAVAGPPGFALSTVDAPSLDEVRLRDVEVLVVNDAPLPPVAFDGTLRRFVERGGGVLVAAGPGLNGAWPGGLDGWLPGTLGGPAEISGAPLRLDATAPGHPVLHPLGARAGGLARAWGYRSLEPRPGDEVLARFENAEPALVERRVGRGATLVFTTTLDPHWSSLAREPGFVPLVQAALSHLARREAPARHFAVGDVVDLARYARLIGGAGALAQRLAAGGPVSVGRPDGTVERLAGRRTPLRLGQPGIHAFSAGGGPERSLPVAVNVDTGESRLAAFTPEGLLHRIVRTAPREAGAEAVPRVAPPLEGPGLAWWLLVVALLLLLGEAALANRIAMRRSPGAAAPARPGVPAANTR